MLRDLDARLLPLLARRLRALLFGGPPGSSGSSGRGPLRRLDDRFAARGPLALLRDVPQVGLLLIAIVLLMGAGAAVAMTSQGAAQAQEATQVGSVPQTLGPAPGSAVAGYLAQSRAHAAGLSRRDPDGRYLALVSLVRQLTPQQSAELFTGSELRVSAAYVRAPVPRSQAQAVAVDGDVVGTLNAAFADTARRRADAQRALLQQADGLAAGDPFRATFEADARTAGLEASAFRQPCACVFALIVSGRAAELAELPAVAAVRGVELAPKGVAPDRLRVRPVVPDDAS